MGGESPWALDVILGFPLPTHIPHTQLAQGQLGDTLIRMDDSPLSSFYTLALLIPQQHAEGDG